MPELPDTSSQSVCSIAGQLQCNVEHVNSLLELLGLEQLKSLVDCLLAVLGPTKGWNQKRQEGVCVL